MIRRLGPRAIQLKTTIIGARSPHTEPNRHIKQLQTKYNRVLDVGCGNGRNFIFPLTIGLDVDVRALRIAKEKGICLCGDGMNLPFVAGFFDLSLFSYSLEYMKYPDKAREEGRRVSPEIYELMYPGYYSWENVQRRDPRILRIALIQLKKVRGYVYVREEDEEKFMASLTEEERKMLE